MRVGILTSWQTPCGIAQYSRYLSRAMVRAGEDVIVLGSRNYGDRALPAERNGIDDPAVLECFDIPMWSDGRCETDVEEILGLGLDVLHVQYQVCLHHRGNLQRILDGFSGVKAITYHDKAIPPDMPGPWDLQFHHRADTGPADILMPFGIEEHPPLVRTFGLGRTQEEIVRPICERHGFVFESAAVHTDNSKWKSAEELHRWLREADAIVLWYPDVDMAGSSQAARTALATRRPVICNDTTWFRDLPNSAILKVADDPEALERQLLATLGNSYVSENSWDAVAQLHLRAYAERMA